MDFRQQENSMNKCLSVVEDLEDEGQHVQVENPELSQRPDVEVFSRKISISFSD